MAELPSMNHHRAPSMDQWAIHENVYSVTNCQYCTKFSSLIYMLMFLCMVFKRKTCHETRLKSKFSAAILCCHKLVNKRGVNIEICLKVKICLANSNSIYDPSNCSF
jgi:hypothetical protein